MEETHKRLQVLADKWDVRYHRVVKTATSLIAFGVSFQRPVVLKVVKRECDEWNAGAVAAAFDGRGVVPVIAHEPGAVLMHELQPGQQLAEIVFGGDDEKACTVIGDVMRRMPEVPAHGEVTTAEKWGEGFERYLASGDKQLDIDLVSAARDAYALLCSTQRRPRLLHGDLQHYNILFDQQRGWTAIDPKGVVAELEFEFGPALRNPQGVPHFYSSEREIERRIRTIAEGLDVDMERIRQWASTQVVLSAIWTIEDSA